MEEERERERRELPRRPLAATKQRGKKSRPVGRERGWLGWKGRKEGRESVSQGVSVRGVANEALSGSERGGNTGEKDRRMGG